MRCRPITRLTLLFVCLFVCSVSSAQKTSQKGGTSVGQFRKVLHEIRWISKNPALMAELQLSDEQVAAMEAVGADFEQDFKAIFEGREEEIATIRQLKKEGRSDEVAELWQGFQEQIDTLSVVQEATISETLLPHQLERIEQIRLQEELRKQNPLGGPFVGPLSLADRLNLNSEQREKLKKATEEARAEYFKALAKIRQDANDHILESLPEEKQEAVRRLLGDHYDHDRARRESIQNWKGLDRLGNKDRRKSKKNKSDDAAKDGERKKGLKKSKAEKALDKVSR